ncbi:MAG: diguanylate cyclase domain-containing protein [Pseudomonadota bacterium]
MPATPEAVAEALRDPGRRRALRRTGLLDAPAEVEFDRLTRMIRDLLHCATAVITLVDHDRQFFLSSLGTPEPWCSRRETPVGDSMCQYVVASGEPFAVRDARDVPELRDKGAVHYLDTIAYLGVPLRAPSGEVIGAVCAVEPAPRAWSEVDVARLIDLAEIARTELLLRHEAGHDPLTGLANRRQFDLALPRRLAAARAAAEPCGLIALDLDGFKPINDRHGHAAGDAVLRAVGERLLDAIEPADLPARIGGDEFAIVLGRTRRLDEVAALEAQLRRTIERPVPFESLELVVRTSVGHAVLSGTAKPEALLAAADAALYRDKASRRRATS